MKRNLIIFSVSVLVLCAVCSCQTKNMAVSSLAGNWNFALDSNDVGEKDHWAMQKFRNLLSCGIFAGARQRI